MTYGAVVTMKRASAALLLLLGLTAICIDASYTVEVGSDQQRCFSFVTPQTPSKVSGSFEMLDDLISSPLVVKIYPVKNDRKDTYISIGHPTGQFHFDTAGTGTSGTVSTDATNIPGEKFKMCIGNGQLDYPNDGKTRTIGFSFKIKPIYEIYEDEGPHTAQFTANMRSAEYAIANLENILNHMEYMKAQEHKNRNLSESTFDNVWKWTLVELVLLLGVSYLQVFNIQRLFKNSRL